MIYNCQGKPEQNNVNESDYENRKKLHPRSQESWKKKYWGESYTRDILLVFFFLWNQLQTSAQNVKRDRKSEKERENDVSRGLSIWEITYFRCDFEN